MWNWLSGKKTIISAVAWPVFELVTSQGWLNGNASMIVAWALTTFTGVGLGHKISKR